MGKHEQRVISDDWYTPKEVFDALEAVFDLDVAHPESKTMVPCKQYISSNSLEQDWEGFVWMNPPFGNQKNKYLWIEKFLKHGNGIALFPDRTSAPWYQHFLKHADGILLVAGKIKFLRPDLTPENSPTTGTTLFACGKKGVLILQIAELNGLGRFYLNSSKEQPSSLSLVNQSQTHV